MSQQLLVDGEPLDALIQIFSYLHTSKKRNGVVNVTGEDIPAAVVAPFWRALMRREARLLREDADAMGDQIREPRTAEQRRADAFVDLITSIDAAERYQADSVRS
jgi:hypothetical protein